MDGVFDFSGECRMEVFAEVRSYKGDISGIESFYAHTAEPLHVSILRMEKGVAVDLPIADGIPGELANALEDCRVSLSAPNYPDRRYVIYYEDGDCNQLDPMCWGCDSVTELGR